jgi:hypothetical protein
MNRGDRRKGQSHIFTYFWGSMAGGKRKKEKGKRMKDEG